MKLPKVGAAKAATKAAHVTMVWGREEIAPCCAPTKGLKNRAFLPLPRRRDALLRVRGSRDDCHGFTDRREAVPPMDLTRLLASRGDA